MASYTSTAAPELKDYEAKELPTYQAQVDKVNETYDKKQDSSIAALQSAYNTSMLEASATLDKIPQAYQKQMNAAAAESEKQRAAFNEYAAGRGINTGTGAQAQLAFSNQMQGDLNNLRAQQATATANAQLEISKIKTQYQDNVAAAIAQNDYERAAALLGEYQAQAQSVVDVAQAQANEYYRAQQSALANQQYTAEWNRSENQYMAEWERQQELTQYQQNLARAETLAAYGDFSGYSALGYSASQIAAMKSYWNAMRYGYGGGGGGGGGYRSSGSGGGGGGGKEDDPIAPADDDKFKKTDVKSGAKSTTKYIPPKGKDFTGVYGKFSGGSGGSGGGGGWK